MDAFSDRLDDRQVRAAKNQSLFREINERIQTLNEGFSLVVPESGDWVCECANESCIELISLTPDEYEAVRAKPNRFFVKAEAAHCWPDVERIVERTDRYWVVEKYGVGAVVAADADPRSPG
jgi:hypothetical protein